MALSSKPATILRHLQDLLESQVTWPELTLKQQSLFDNLNFNLILNTDSPQQTYQLLQAAPDLLPLLQNVITPSPPTTPTTVPTAVITANLLEESELLSSTQTPKSTADWVNLAIKNHLRNQEISSRLQSKPQIKRNLQQAITQATPKQTQPLPQTQKTLQKLITSIDSSLETSLTPPQKTRALNLAKAIIISSSLQTNTPSHLVTTTTAINLVKQPQKPDPVKIAHQVDRLNIHLQQTPSLIDQINTSQQEVSHFVHTVSTQKPTLKILNQLHTQITPQDIDHVIKLYHQTVPREQQKDLAPFTSLEGEKVASAIEVFDQNTATIVRAYNKGFTSKTIKLILEQPTVRLTPPQYKQLLLVKSQFDNLEQSSLSSDIQFTPPSKITSFISRSPLGRIINHLPSNRFTKTLNVILHPRSAIKSWIGHRIGKRLAVSFYKKFATHITNKSARFVVKSVIRGGLKKGLDTAKNILIKKGATWLASKGIALGAETLIGGGTGGIGFIIIEGIKIAVKIAKKIWNNLQSSAVSLWGEKLKLRDLATAPTLIFAGAISGFTAAITATSTAMAAAATSAGLTIGISAAIAGLLYLTAFTTAPLISTIAQLESTPGANFGISNTCAETENIFVYQGNPAWSRVFCKQCSTSGKCNIGHSGCGSASMTMILKSFGADMDVKQVWHLQHSLRGYAYTPVSKPYMDCGTDNNNSLKVFNPSGLSVSNIFTNEIDSVLSNCGLVLATGQVKYEGEYYGHLLVIIGHNSNKITTLDPGRSDGDHYVHTLGNSYKIARLWSVVP